MPWIIASESNLEKVWVEIDKDGSRTGDVRIESLTIPLSTPPSESPRLRPPFIRARPRSPRPSPLPAVVIPPVELLPIPSLSPSPSPPLVVYCLAAGVAGGLTVSLPLLLLHLL